MRKLAVGIFLFFSRVLHKLKLSKVFGPQPNVTPQFSSTIAAIAYAEKLHGLNSQMIRRQVSRGSERTVSQS
jgi:hypothetical protein